MNDLKRSFKLLILDILKPLHPILWVLLGLIFIFSISDNKISNAQTAADLPITITTSTQQRVTGNTTSKRMVRTSDGTIHAVAHLGTNTLTCGGISKSGLVWIYTTDSGNTWTCGAQLATGNAINASIISDASDNIHIILSTNTAGVGNNNDVSYVKLTKGAGSTWTLGSSHLVLNGTTTAGYSYGDITIEGTTRIWVTARYYDGTNYQVVTYYSADMQPSDSAHWSVSSTSISSAGTNSSYHIPTIIRFGNKIGVAYSDQSGTGKINWRERAGSDGLTTWSTETIIASGNINAANFKAMSDSNNNVHFIYVDSSSSLLYSHYNGTTWGTPFTLGASVGANAAISTDGTNVWVGYADGTGYLNSIKKLLYKKGVPPFQEANFDSVASDVLNSQGVFDKVLAYVGGVYTDETSSAGDTNPSDVELGVNTGDYLYVGRNEKFENITWSINVAGVGGSINWEYWDGSAWADLTIISSQNDHFTATGSLLFSAPSDWSPVNVNSAGEYYYIRAAVETNYSVQPEASQLTSSSSFISLSMLETIPSDSVYFYWSENGTSPYYAKVTYHSLGDPAPTVTTITPNSADNDEDSLNITVDGTGFQDGATITLVPDSGPSIDATDVSFINSTQLTGTVDLYNQAEGVYDVVVTNPDDQSGVLNDGFTLNDVLTVSPVQITPEGGTFIDSVLVDMFTYTEDAVIYYTTDGSEPDDTDNLYTTSFILIETITIKAKAFKDGMNPSETVTAVFTVNPAAGNQAPVASGSVISTTVNTNADANLNYTDPDSGPGPYTITIVDAPDHGILIGTGSSRTYHPDSDYIGSDSFTWKVNDGEDDSNTATVTINVSEGEAGESSALIVNHTHVDLFTSIPDEYLTAARNKKVLFRHASVGANISQGLDCMASSSPVSSCTTNNDPGWGSIGFINDPEKYDRSNWTFECHTLDWASCNPGWYNKHNMFIDRIAGDLDPTEDYPTLEDAQNFDVWGFKFGNVDDNTDINHYWEPSGTYANQPSYEELVALESANPTKTLMYWTMGIARLSYKNSHDFNNTMRSFAQNNNKVLFDFADIVSHHPDDTSCTDTDGLGNTIDEMCDEYTQEVNGGHLNARAKTRVAQAFWVMMSCIAGWDGCGQTFSTENPPVITSINPDSGAVEDEVSFTITGTDFAEGVTVQLISGDTVIDALGESVNGSTQITGSFDLSGVIQGEYDLVVVNPDNQFDTLIDGFTVTAPVSEPPDITEINPDTVINIDSDVFFTITGLNFEVGATVELVPDEGSPISATGLNVTSTAITGNFDLTGVAVGTYSLRVTNPDEQSDTLVDGFTVTLPEPSVLSIDPNTGQNDDNGLAFTVSGLYFVDGAIVQLVPDVGDSINATEVIVVNSTTITGSFDLSGLSAGMYDVVVVNPDTQSDSLNNGFTVTEAPNPPPNITSINPNSGNNNDPALSFTILGSGFSDGLTVQLLPDVGDPALATNVNVVNDTQVTGSFELDGIDTGVYDVVVTNTDEQSDTLTDGFTVTVPPPQITNIDPDTGVNNDTGLEFTITGESFVIGTTVELIAEDDTLITATDVIVNNSTEIMGSFNLDGVDADIYDVVVTNPDSQSDTLTDGFTVTEAPKPPPVISMINPNYTYNNDSSFEFEIIGSEFQDGAEITFVSESNNVLTATNVVVTSSTQINGIINVDGVEAGSYDVVVTNTDLQSDTLDNAFIVNEFLRITDIIVETTDTSAEINWHTSVDSSSLIQYGFISPSENNTSETDTAPNVTEHQVLLNNLSPCTTYKFIVRSEDSDENVVLSDEDSFTTDGCTGESSVMSQTTREVNNNEGDHIILNLSGGGILEITIPDNASLHPVLYYQIQQLIAESVKSETLILAEYKNILGNYVAEIKSHIDISNINTTFVEPIEIKFTYTNSLLSGFDETSMVIYRWDGNQWNLLDDCIADTNANTVTCTTTSFSTFALMGKGSVNTEESDDDDREDKKDNDCKKDEPDSPAKIIKVVTTSTSATLYIKPAKGDSNKYKIYYGLNQFDNFITKFIKWDDSSDLIIHTINNLESGKQYFFKVKAYNGCADGEISHVIAEETLISDNIPYNDNIDMQSSVTTETGSNISTETEKELSEEEKGNSDTPRDNNIDGKVVTESEIQNEKKGFIRQIISWIKEIIKRIFK